MHKEIQIENRKVGLNHSPLVIVEIGINHEGSLKTAFEMVDAAWKAGAEVIKHQTHVVEDEMSKEAKKVIPGNANVSIYEIMERCALNEEDEIKLKDYVESKGMIFMSTPFSRAAADRLERMGVSSYKIGSGECNNYPLIEHIAAFRKPMIVSTGMNDIEQVRKTVEILENYNVPYVLMYSLNFLKQDLHNFDGEHYWEINKKNYDETAIREKMTTDNWKLVFEKRLFENPYHRFYLLEKNEK